MLCWVFFLYGKPSHALDRTYLHIIYVLNVLLITQKIVGIKLEIEFIQK